MSERATKYDAMFLYTDNKVAEMQVAAASIAEGQIDYERYRNWVAPRILRVPRLCQYPKFSPFNLRYPMWTDVPDFDPRDQIEHIQLSAPGNDEQLRDLLTERFHIRLDRTKPLWRLLIINGLEGNRSTMVFYVHHCICDGTSAVEIFKALYDDPEGDWPEHHDLARAESHASKPSVPVRIVRGLRSEQTRTQLKHIWRYLKAPGPWFPFTRAISGRVNFSWRDFPLDQLHETRRVLGGTITDVGLAALGGALDRYAARQGMDVSGKYFKVALPENVRPAELYGEMGNNVSVIPTLVPLGIEDPAERLRQVTAYTRMAKEHRLGRCVHGVLSGLMDFIGPVGTAWLTKLLASPAWIRFASRIVKTPREHAIVTSVRSAPGLDSYIDGLLISRTFPLVPCGLELGVMCALIAYRNQLQVALTGDSATMPNIDELMDDFEAEIEAMHRAALTEAPPVSEPLPEAVGK